MIGSPLITCTDSWSVRTGGRAEVNVSCRTAIYRADLVRIRGGDPNPSRPGLLFEGVPAAFEGRYPGRLQAIHNGTHGVVPLGRLVYFETTKGAAVFSVSSITFCGSLPWNNLYNQSSTLLRNVVNRFTAQRSLTRASIHG